MGTQGVGRKRLPNRERLTAEDDALNQIAREDRLNKPEVHSWPFHMEQFITTTPLTC